MQDGHHSIDNLLANEQRQQQAVTLWSRPKSSHFCDNLIAEVEPQRSWNDQEDGICSPMFERRWRSSNRKQIRWHRVEVHPLCLPKIRSVLGNGARKQNRSMIGDDDCHLARTLDVHCRLVQAALAASGREPGSSPPTWHRIEAHIHADFACIIVIVRRGCGRIC